MFFTATVAIVKSITNCSVVMNERKKLSHTHANTQEGSMSESNGHTAPRGLHGCLPSPPCRNAQPVQSVGGFILALLLVFHMNEKVAAVTRLAF